MCPMNDVQLADGNVYFPLHRLNSSLHNRLAYAYSEYSSSLSSFSAASRWQNQSELQRNANSRRASILYWIPASIIIALSAGICSVYGIFQQSYMLKLASLEDDSFTRFHYFGLAFVGALQLTCFMAFQRVPSIIKKPIIVYATMLIGTVTIGGGLLAAGFSNQLWQLWLSQGVLVGTGGALSLMSAVEVLKTHQLLRKSSPVVTISGIGGCIMAVITWQLIVKGEETDMALRWLAIIAWGGLLIAEAVLFIINQYNQKHRISSTNWIPEQHAATASNVSSQPSYSAPPTKNTLRKPHVVLALVSTFCFYLSAPAPFLFIVNFAAGQTANANLGWGVALLAVMCLASAVGGITIPRALQNQLISHGAKLGLMQLCLSLSVWCFWLAVSGSWAILLIFCIIYGLLFGSASQLILTDNCDLSGSKTQTFSWMWTLCSITGTFIGICVDGLLLTDWIDSNMFSYTPLVTFVASASLAAAAASTMSALTNPPLDYKHVIAKLNRRTPPINAL